MLRDSQEGNMHAHLQKSLPYHCFNPRLVLHNLPGKRIPEAEVHRRRDAPLCQLCTFFVQNAFDPPPFLDIFMTYWEALCTTLRLDRIRHRSEETVKYTRIFGKLPRGAGRPFSIQKIILQILHLYIELFWDVF